MSPRRLLFLAVPVLAVGCDTGLPGSGGDGRDASASCVEARGHDDLEWIQQKIFLPSCGMFADCHRGAAAKEMLRMEDAQTSWMETVDVSAVQVPAMKLVAPGDPARSYLLIKMGHGDQGLLVKDLMPYRTSLLCREKIDAVARWVMAGAPPVGMPDAALPDAPPDAPPDADEADGAPDAVPGGMADADPADAP